MPTVAVKPPEGGVAWRSYNFRPRDPVWAPSGALASLRRLLSERDWKLSIWWSPGRRGDDPKTPGRWRVVQWLASTSNWHTIFYWEGPRGEYRDIWPIEPIIQRIMQADRPLREAEEDAESSNYRMEAKRKAALKEDLKRYWEDYSARHGGRRQSFGSITRPRSWKKPEELLDTNHKRWMRENGLAPSRDFEREQMRMKRMAQR